MSITEAARLHALRGLDVLDCRPEQVYDDLVLLASRIAGVPIGLVTLVDADRVWFKARTGLDVSSAARTVAFCTHVVENNRELEVPDARLDPRFCDNPLVTGRARIVSYAGFPLVVGTGETVGTLCVVGSEPKVLTDEQRHGLRVLAGQVATLLDLRRRDAEQAEERVRFSRIEDELSRSRREFQLLAEHSNDVISRLDAQGRLTYVSPSISTVLGYSAAEVAGQVALEQLHPDDRGSATEAMAAMVAGETRRLTARSRHADGSWRWLEVTLSPRVDAASGLVEVYSAARDVTDRVLAAQELARNAEFTVAVLDSVDVGIVACDQDGRLTLLNPAAREWHGLGSEAELSDRGLSPADHPRHFDLYGPDGTTLLPPDEVPLHVALTAGSVQGLEFVIAPEGLAARHVRCDGRALHDESGTVIGAVVAMTDVTAARQTLRTLAAERRRLEESQRIGQLGSFEYDARTGEFLLSDQLVRIWGLQEVADPLSDGLECIIPEERERVGRDFRHALRTGGRHEITYGITRRSDGAMRNIRSVVEVAERGPDGRPLEVRGTNQDVTEVSEAERAATEAHAFLDAVITASPDFTFVTDLATGGMVFSSGVSPLGFSGEEILRLGQVSSTELVHPADRDALQASNDEAARLADGDVAQLRYRGRHRDGSWRWLSGRVTPFRRDREGNVTQLVGVTRDCTDVVEAEERLRHAALHDHMTGLPNRLLLHDQLTAALDGAAETGREVAVLFIDLDGFKRVNDTAGHASGDAVLLETSRRISAALRPHDTVARVGGDEFVVIAEARTRDGVRGKGRSTDSDPASERSLALTLAERITTAIATPISVGESRFSVTASIGVSFATGSTGPGTVPAEQLLQDADTAMYEAKSQGKDRFVVYESSLSTERQQRGIVERELRWALGEDELASAPRSQEGVGLYPVYQPVFGPDGRLSSFEALARLSDRSGVSQPTDLVIGVAEDTGLIRRLGARMLDEALAQLACWRRDSPAMARVRMAVNVSAVQAQDPGLAGEVRQAIARHGLSGGDLILELTETALLHASTGTIEALEGLRADGVRIVIDDFGVGYASLTYLTTLPVTGVKIDRSFTCGLPDSPSKTRVVGAVAGLSADLGLTCVAEGVETQEQYTALPAGVYAQGYLLARPAAASRLDVPALLLADHARPVG